MREDFDDHRDVWGPALAAQMRLWAAFVMAPARQLYASGLAAPEHIGEAPAEAPLAGGGPSLVETPMALHLLDAAPPGYDRLRHFDIAAEEYRQAIAPYAEAVFEALMARLGPLLVADAHILDASCGPGAEAIALAQRVPDGEVVAADLSRGMIEQAFREARRQGVDNMAFYQADAERLPAAWDGHFDAVVCQLSFHFYAAPEHALESFFRVLKPAGQLFIADPGDDMLNQLAEPLVRRANPGFVGYTSGERLVAMLRDAGFDPVYWEASLPGIGIAQAVRP